MLAEADYYAAGQQLKLKATSPLAALNEALEYLVKNTFTKMGYLKVLCQEPLKEIQAILRSERHRPADARPRTGGGQQAGDGRRAQLRRL